MLNGKVAIITGAGAGLGRCHALLLARYGAKILVNDLGEGADSVAAEIVAMGGESIGFRGSVTDEAQVAAMVGRAMERWGRIDILVNNAGILRDKSFSKMNIDDFRLIIDVHLMGSVICTKAVWDIMRAQNFGRVVMTTSSSGLWGNFGQSNYGAAKMALVGLMQTLGLEGARNNVHVNCLAPTAATAMLEGILPEAMTQYLAPSLVSPGLLSLVHDHAPNRVILNGGSGHFSRAYLPMTNGVFVGEVEDAGEQVIARWDELGDRHGEMLPQDGSAQAFHQLAAAGYKASPATEGSE